MNEDSYVFMFSLLLEDEKPEGGSSRTSGKNETKSWLQAIVFGRDGEDFFQGIQPTNLYSDRAGRKVLEERLSKLLSPRYDDADSNQPERKKFRQTQTLCGGETAPKNVHPCSDIADLLAFDFCLFSYYVWVDDGGEDALYNGCRSREREEKRSVTVEGKTSENWKRRFRLFDSVLA